MRRLLARFPAFGTYILWTRTRQWRLGRREPPEDGLIEFDVILSAGACRLLASIIGGDREEIIWATTKVVTAGGDELEQISFWWLLDKPVDRGRDSVMRAAQ
jgi:hypothetical protein